MVRAFVIAMESVVCAASLDWSVGIIAKNVLIDRDGRSVSGARGTSKNTQILLVVDENNILEGRERVGFMSRACQVSAGQQAMYAVDPRRERLLIRDDRGTICYLSLVRRISVPH